MAEKQKPVKGYYSNQHQGPDIDCCVCIHRKECENAQEGKFCGRFQSKAFEPKGVNPNDLWEKGEEVEF